ncbi:MAG: PSD1 and planctomycete cytochrome C domain-containing protein [Planctomycetaceae bacterium]
MKTAPAVTAITLLFAGVVRADGPVTEAKVDFPREILPILSNKCFVCHGPDSHDADLLRLDSFETATADRGGYRAIDPQHPDQSEILKRIHSADDPMPPADAEKQLSPQERDVITRWVKQGGTYAMHWAFVPPKKQVPAIVTSSNASDIIDAFIAEKQAAQGVTFAPEADRATLARRAALTLIGLPPEPKQLEAFLSDNRPDAYERYVDDLLADPHYGEHQARYWLDAVRYGDTHGLHLDNRRGIYPYRDWVVNAFNSNLPLNEFITWQLAGDLLPEPSLDQLVATGYVRLNPSTGEGGAIPDEFQVKNNFDRVETLGTVFLGMSLTCARCHSHKYDPIPQTEYYRLLAFFNNTTEPPLDGNKYEYGAVVKAPQNQDSWNAWHELAAERADLIDTAKAALTKSATAEELTAWETADADQRLQLLADQNGPFAKLAMQQPAADLIAKITAAQEQFTTTLVAEELPEPRKTFLLRRGEYDLPTGDPLDPGVISVMGSLPADAPKNRLGLAQWLTSSNHPLVARVLINRVWQNTFGYGLVRTPEDFGLQGRQPTHPELLDWLAVELQDSGWDLKHMRRLMVNSRTFRQNSAWRTDVDDPENRLLARGPGYRLDAEVIRDIGLWSSNLLDPQMGGEGVKPYQPAGMWEALAHPASNTKNYVADTGPLLYRRSLYVYWKRTSPHPMMTLFDAPDRESSCVRRSRTSTPLQSLGMLNETQRIEMSRKLAERLLHEGANTAERLSLLFTLVASRPPTDVERSACERLLKTMQARYQNATEDAVALLSTGEAKRDESLDPAELASWTQVCVTVLASDLAILMY